MELYISNSNNTIIIIRFSNYKDCSKMNNWKIKVEREKAKRKG